MYTQHSALKQPGRSACMWRYQDIGKLLKVIQNQALWFSRADRFEDDRHEGSLPDANVALREEGLLPFINAGPELKAFARDGYGQQITDAEASRMAMRTANAVKNILIEKNQHACRSTTVSCWHMNDVESVAMWNLYCKSAEAVAIQSTFGRMVDSLKNAGQEVYGGVVKYLNYQTQPMPWNDLSRFAHKRSCFSHEQEFRLIVKKDAPTKSGKIDFKTELFPTGGILVHVDLTILIDKLVISPKSPPGFEAEVTSLVQKNGFSFPVERSSLNRPPSF